MYTSNITKLIATTLNPNHYSKRTNNIPFRGWIGQRHFNAMSDSRPPKLDGKMLPSRSFWNLAEAIKHENFNVFMVLSWSWHCCFLMTRVGHLGSLKSK